MSPTKMDATEVKRHFGEEMAKVATGKQRLVIEKNGKPLVAVVSLEDLALLEREGERVEDRLDVEAYREAKSEIARTGEKPVPWAQFKREHKVPGPTAERRPRRATQGAKPVR